MMVFIFTLVVFTLAMAALAVGIWLGRGPLRGSCGGSAVVRMCGVCRKDIES